VTFDLFRIFCLFSALLFWGGSSPARADNYTVVPLRDDPSFADVHFQLQAMVNVFGFHSVNHFCIIAYRAKDDDAVVPHVYWPTQDKMIVWGVGSDLLLASTDYLDLRRDILPGGTDTSPDYLTHAEVDGLITDCRERGSAYTIIKTYGGWKRIDEFPEFSTVKAQLQYLVDHKASEKLNDFCVIGQNDNDFLAAYIYWKTQDQLLYWLPSKYDVDDPFAVADSPVQIDLKRGLRDEEDAGNERNQMQRSYADAILRACRNMGQNFVVQKSN
jgi:hypothetical protein